MVTHLLCIIACGKMIIDVKIDFYVLMVVMITSSIYLQKLCITYALECTESCGDKHLTGYPHTSMYYVLHPHEGCGHAYSNIQKYRYYAHHQCLDI